MTVLTVPPREQIATGVSVSSKDGYVFVQFWLADMSNGPTTVCMTPGTAIKLGAQLPQYVRDAVDARAKTPIEWD